MKPAAVPSIFLLASTVVLVGCGGSSPMIETSPGKPVPPATSSLQGQAFGGQQPVTGMTLQLYDASTSGYGSSATGVLATPLPTTDSNGNFHFHLPACTNGSDQMYLVGTGGDPVAGNASNGGSTSANANLALMVALGNCSGLGSLPGLHMNELTTVAAVWALAPFMSGNTQAYQNIGTSSTNILGLQLAFQAAQQVASISTGTLPGTLPSGATVQTNEVNTVADVLEACINSKGGVEGDSSPCGNLFAAAPSTSGSNYPTDTITAAMNIAQNPARNVATLDQGISNTSTFNPVVASPTAFTIAIQYSGGGLNAPTAVATDQSGNVWVTNSGASTVSLFANSGGVASSFPSSGATLAGTPGGIAIDLTGNAWITIPGSNSVVEMNSSGIVTKTVSDSGIGLNDPTSIAIDGGGNIWVVNSAGGANSVSAFDSTGTKLTNSPFTGGGINSPVAIAINGNANANCSDCH
jgi:DNA-binding beta-propeller fold protein YncE